MSQITQTNGSNTIGSVPLRSAFSRVFRDITNLGVGGDENCQTPSSQMGKDSAKNIPYSVSNFIILYRIRIMCNSVFMMNVVQEFLLIFKKFFRFNGKLWTYIDVPGELSTESDIWYHSFQRPDQYDDELILIVFTSI